LAKALINNPNLKTKMTEAGIVGSPRIEINEEVESILLVSPDPVKIRGMLTDV
jgi:hypothetical protein